jgi:hypothetical protein
MKFLAALALTLFSGAAASAPFLQTKDPYPFPANVPQTAYTFSATATPGPFSLTCVVTAGKPMCDSAAALAQAPGTITFVMSVSRTAGCDSTGATCWGAGTASSTPFLLNSLGTTVSPPLGLLQGL